MRCNKEECPPSAIRESLLSAVKAQGSQKEITKKKTKNKKQKTFVLEIPGKVSGCFLSLFSLFSFSSSSFFFFFVVL